MQFFEDVAYRVTPVGKQEATAMTEEIQAAPMLRGARGRNPTNIDHVVETIQRVSQLMIDFPQIKELNINPLVAAPTGVYATDLRISLDPANARSDHT